MGALRPPPPPPKGTNQGWQLLTHAEQKSGPCYLGRISQVFPVVPATLKSRLLKGEVVKAQIDSQFQFRQRDQMMHLILGPPLDSLPTGFTQEYKFDFWHMGRVLGRCL